MRLFGIQERDFFTWLTDHSREIYGLGVGCINIPRRYYCHDGDLEVPLNSFYSGFIRETWSMAFWMESF